MSYATLGYQFGAYSGGPTFAALFLMGASVVAPAGSNLIAPMPVGRYGAWSNSNSIAKTASKQFPVRIGPHHGFVSLIIIARPPGTPPDLPAYGN
jgi:hypothetical protein